MGKNKKKRNKVYQGQDARAAQATITRISAVNRNPVAQWWYDKKRIAKPVLVTSGVVAIVALLIVEIFKILAG